jgi:hypothetical protein
MKLKTNLLIGVLIIAMTGTAPAQEAVSGAQAVANLRIKLSEVKDREAGIKIRLEELNYDLKPENIERYFQGYGSTRPEELREGRRKQLQIEKDRLMGQLDELALARSHLENQIMLEQTRAIQQNAGGSLSLERDGNNLSQLITVTRVLIVGSVLFLVLASLAVRIWIRRRTNA